MLNTYTSFESSPLLLESGTELGPIDTVYETYGTLNSDRSNAVLVCHALTGDSHVASSSEDTEPGWWEFIVGPGKPIDTSTHFVVCPNVLGSCYGSTGPSSQNPKTNTTYRLDFPVFTIGDMVRVQHDLMTHLGISKWRMILGPSMGGMQAMEWAAMYPDCAHLIAIVAAAGHLSPQALAFNSVGRKAILSDEKWKAGQYGDEPPENGLSIARMIGHITYLSEESISEKFGRKLQERNDYSYDFSSDFQIESYLEYQGSKFVDRFDANSYIYIAKAMAYFDMVKKYSSLMKAFEKSTARFLVMSILSDWLYPPRQAKEIVTALLRLNKDVTYTELDSEFGHDSFLTENPRLNAILGAFLKV